MIEFPGCVDRYDYQRMGPRLTVVARMRPPVQCGEIVYAKFQLVESTTILLHVPLSRFNDDPKDSSLVFIWVPPRS